MSNDNIHRGQPMSNTYTCYICRQQIQPDEQYATNYANARRRHRTCEPKNKAITTEADIRNAAKPDHALRFGRGRVIRKADGL